jgi:hypothetical protein
MTDQPDLGAVTPDGAWWWAGDRWEADIDAPHCCPVWPLGSQISWCVAHGWLLEQEGEHSAVLARRRWFGGTERRIVWEPLQGPGGPRPVGS